MREILFRGMTETNEWIFGDLIHSIKGIMYIQDIVNGIGEEKYRQPIFVQPETVGQYTGLKDKDGTKIFEGDHLRHTTERHFMGYVRYNMDRFEVYDEFKINTDSVGDISHVAHVIGNIHEK